MGVIPTGAIYKTLTFDGKSSSEFNVYITGEAVFNAPEKAVEMVSIAGRNGAFALDYGRFENIEVTYNCGIVADDETDFAGAISDFRNWLCSRNGYVRLSDDYNTGEYRQAVYKSGLEVETARLIAGEFPIVFECKPQRFLTSGETAVAVTSGDDITNPTLFDAKPQLQVYGYGAVNIGNKTVRINNTTIGMVALAAGTSGGETVSTIINDTTIYDIGDDIIVNVPDGYNCQQEMACYQRVSAINYTKTVDTLTTSLNIYRGVGAYGVGLHITLPQVTFTAGTATSYTNTYSFSITDGGGTYTGTIGVTISYDGVNTITISETRTGFSGVKSINNGACKIGEVWADSTISTLLNPIYIDLDIGEAWADNNGTIISENNTVQIPAELPTLSAGNTTIIYDNTITQFKVVPRWWKI